MVKRLSLQPLRSSWLRYSARHKPLNAKSTNTSIHILPDELILLIAEQLGSEASINAFAQVNRRMHSIVIPYLYRYNALHSRHPALSWAAKRGKIETAKYALECGAKIDLLDDNGQSPLQLAVTKQREEMVTFLLERGADPNYELFNDTMLNIATRYGNRRVVEACIEGGADIDRANCVGATPIATAVTRLTLFSPFHGKLVYRGILELLLMKGGDPNVPDGIWGMTPLHFADCEEGAALLLEYGADINRRDSTSATPLDEARRRNREKMVEFFLKHGAKTGSGQ